MKKELRKTSMSKKQNVYQNLLFVEYFQMLFKKISKLLLSCKLKKEKISPYYIYKTNLLYS